MKRLVFLLLILAVASSSQAYTYHKYKNPARTEVRDNNNAWVATFTNGSYTVTLIGPGRSFSERTATYSVTHTIWVRTLSTPFNGKVNTTWLNNALAMNQNQTPDVLGIAMQYIEEAPAQFEGTLQIAGDASYGPLQPDGTRQEGSDFNDYLGVVWNYPDGSRDNPEAEQKLCLDCSGFMRMVFGYRNGVPLCLSPKSDHSAMPRRSFEIFDAAPGIVTITNKNTQVTDFSKLSTGDLVFFDADTGDGTQIDHVGMYLGIDSGGNHRFISSRKSIDGPTLGDFNGKSVLNGTGLYAKSFRCARRM